MTESPDIENQKVKIIVICGPTGIGKTSTAIGLARHFGGQIISADSMQIYRYMDIGTAKPTREEQSQIFHHMIDIVDPDESFDAAQFARMSDMLIGKMNQDNLIPFIVGGTGLYIKALIYGLFENGPRDDRVRDKLKAKLETHGAQYLHQQLAKVDPKAYGKIHVNDTYRIVRALEIYELTGKPISYYQGAHQFSRDKYDVLFIGLNIDRKLLYKRIDARVDIMIAQGLVGEVKYLRSLGYSPDLKSMQSIGYRHVNQFLSGDMDWDETARTMKRDTRRYAKRQLTWFGANPDIIWAQPDQFDELKIRIETFLEQKAD